MMPAPQCVLVTGASSGIGAALARRYAAAGVHLALTGRDAARLAAVAEGCRNAGATVDSATLDVTDRTAMRRWIEGVDDARPIDLAIANAGIAHPRPDEEEGRRILAVNVEGVLNTVMPLLPRMTARGRGQIALMSSLAGYRGLPGAAFYSASKAAVKSLAEAWRIDCRPRGVHVSVICPGFVATPLTARNRSPMPFLQSAERAADIIARGLARDAPRIAFPGPLAGLTWLVASLPARLSDRLLARFAGRDDAA